MSVTLKQILEFEEGLKLEPYLCPAKHWTIGIGWNLEAHGLPGFAWKEFWESSTRYPHISQEAAYRLLDISIEPAIKDARVFYMPGLNRPLIGMTDARRRACENMAFQLGYTRLAGFKKTQQYIQAGDWIGASAECLDSKWAREDSPERAKRVSRVFETGDDAFYEALF